MYCKPLSVGVASPASSATWLGKTISDVQTDIQFGAGNITGTLKHIENWTQYSANPEYNTGNFIAFKVTAAAGATIYAGLKNPIDPTRPEWVTDADGEFIFQVSDKAAQALRVKVVKGDVTQINEYVFTDLTLETE